jgi:hypothetical protein
MLTHTYTHTHTHTCLPVNEARIWPPATMGEAATAWMACVLNACVCAHGECVRVCVYVCACVCVYVCVCGVRISVCI